MPCRALRLPSAHSPTPAQLHATILTLQTQLASRPPLETIQSLEKEYKNLDLILQGTQRENERCMAELERVRTRERSLEQALAKLAGENWQVGDPPGLGCGWSLIV